MSLMTGHPQSAPDPVAGHGRAHGLAHDEARPTRLPIESTCRFIDICGHQVHDQERTAGPTSTPNRLLEVSGGGQAMAGGQHPVARPQTARLLRPLRRRADRIARPARVRIRRRKPCTLCRRRLFGWYVRLLTSSSPEALFGTVREPARTTQDAASHTEQLAPPTRAEGPNDTRRTGFDLPTVRGASRQGQFEAAQAQIRPEPTILTVLLDQMSTTRRGRMKPVENRLPDTAVVVSVRAPDTPEKWTSALNSALAHPTHPVDKGVDRHNWTNQT